MFKDWLIKRAKRTPYFHLTGYMNRFWLVPYNRVIVRQIRSELGFGSSTAFETDGTGLVSWRRPFTRLLQHCGIAARIHEILRSDEGRHPHNHPWPFLTVILKGGYFEHTYRDDGTEIGVKWHGPGSILWRPANSWHRLVVPTGMVATTLFITGKKAQTWGFNVDGQVVPYFQYLNEKERS